MVTLGKLGTGMTCAGVQGVTLLAVVAQVQVSLVTQGNPRSCTVFAKVTASLLSNFNLYFYSEADVNNFQGNLRHSTA